MRLLSSIIKAERLVVDHNYTLVGEEMDILLIEGETGISLSQQLLTMEDDDEARINAELEPTASEQIIILREEAEHILQETEEMVVEILDRARGEASVIISNAREEAQMIKANAEEEANKLIPTVIDQGHREGLQLAFRETEEQRKKARLEYEQFIATGTKEKAELIRSAETEIVKLAIAVAEKILTREIKTDPTIILDIAREALILAGEAENVRVMVNPDDADTVKYFVPQLIEPDQNVGNITIESDRRIDQGGCLIETEKGIVDARLQTRRFNIEGAVREVLNHA